MKKLKVKTSVCREPGHPPFEAKVSSRFGVSYAWGFSYRSVEDAKKDAFYNFNRIYVGRT